MALTFLLFIRCIIFVGKGFVESASQPVKFVSQQVFVHLTSSDCRPLRGTGVTNPSRTFKVIQLRTETVRI